MPCVPFHPAVLAISLLGVVVGCSFPRPDDAQIGCTYDAQSSSVCPGYVMPPKKVMEAGVAAEASVDAADAATGLGDACVGPNDCAPFLADYCLMSPAGSFPSFCTITGCTPMACGNRFVCCDCKASFVSQLQAFPANVCVTPTIAAALPDFGCTCLSQPGDAG
jgi:hypothetical protein